MQKLEKKEHGLLNSKNMPSLSEFVSLKLILSRETIKVGVHLKTSFSPLNLGLMRISRSRFKQSNPGIQPSAHFTNLCFAVICKFLGDFWGFFGRDSFSQRMSKIWRNKKY